VSFSRTVYALIDAKESGLARFDMTTPLSRITVNPAQCGGRPCVRGMRIRVSDVLDLFSAGLTAEQILAEMPDLEAQDLQACLQFAGRRLDHPIVAAK
jgi:uncharacterized protein (DUF433 family)